MDALDLRILATMGYVPWGPAPQDVDRLRPSTLADELGLTPETVRERISGMEEGGAIASWEAYPNPQHAGVQIGGWAFRPSSRHRVEDTLEDVLLVDGVLEVFTYRGPFVGVGLAFEDGAQRERRLELLSSRLGDKDPVHVIDPPMPEVEEPLDRIDWSIVAALRGQARRPLSEVAEEVDRSYRTVKRRFDRMTSEGSLFVVPRVDLSRVAGILPFTLVSVVDDPPSDVANRVSRRFGDRVLHRLIPPDKDARLLVLGLFAQTVAQMEALADEATEIEGVESSRALLSAGRYATSWLDERVQSNARET